MRVGTIGVSALLVVGAGWLCTGQEQRQPTAEVFPMRKGTHWIYRGDVAWQASGESAEVHRSQLDWNMEIVDSVQRGRYKVALIIGHPKDLTWYEEGRQPGCDVLIGVDDKKFYLVQCAPSASREKLTSTEGDLSSMINEDNLIFWLPIGQGDSFGGDPERTVKDGMYAWRVQAIRQATLKGIGGISGTGPWTEYILTYRTYPDHEIDTYVPGIGLTAYVYSHHGTVSEVNVKLVEFQLPNPK
jgi:hypothetical protein